ncbi:MAG: protein kinase [Cellvibrionaceae bacterium]
MIDIPGYKIVRTLGRGGMASVYLAIQESFEREVALKVMNAALSEDPKFTARFLHEARIVSRLMHPNIVTVYDVGVQDNQHYLSMEYVPGLDLKHKRKFLTPPQSLQVIRDVAKALDYAGKKGYVHRDVKPENIMLHDEDGRAVLMDFGIACLADTSSGMTQTGTAIGTPHYMSPEQAKGRQVDSRSDIYSLGVVLYLLLTGHVPYDADSAVAVGIKHVQDDIPRLPGNLLVLQPIINKVLAKNPNDRYQSGAELVAAIDAVTDEDIEAIQLATKHYALANTEGDTSSARQKVALAKGSDQTLVTAAAHGPRPTAAAAEASTRRRGVSGRHRAMRRHTLGQTQAAPDIGTSATERVGGGILAVEAEDTRDYHSREDGQQKRLWPWVVAGGLVLVLSGTVFFRDYLPPPMAAIVDDYTDRSVTIGSDITENLRVAMGLSTPPPARLDSALPERADAEARAIPEGLALPLNNAPSLDSLAPQTAGQAVTAGNPLTGEDSVVSERARSLRDQLGEDLSVAPQLAQLYRDALGAVPDDKKAEWGLRELLDYHYRHLRSALQERDLDQAQSYFESLEASFPPGAGVVELGGEESYQRLQERFASASEAQDHIEQGERYLADDALTAPEDANALQAFQRALEIDSGNPLAQAGVQRIVERHVQLTNESMERGDPETAAQLADRGLRIDPGSEELTRLASAASAQLERRRQMEQLATLAQRQMDAENYLSPKGESAYDYYRQLLQFDAGNSQATNGLAQLERNLVHTIETHINRNQFDQARNLLLAARNAYANSERLTALELALDRAVEADFLSRQPRVSKILVSSIQTDSIGQVQAQTLNAERTLYIGFSYENFESRTSVVQAMLYDGSRSIQIAQVPVIVSGTDGVKFFQIDRPVQGFSEGSYNIDLMLNEDRLNTLSFRVERAQPIRQSSQAAAADASQNNAVSQ